MSRKNPIKSRFLILKIWKYLSKKRQKTILFSLLIMVLSGFAELITISSVIPFLTVLINPDKLLTHPISIYLSKILNISEIESLYLPIISFFGLCIIISTILRLYNLYLNFNISALIGSDLSVKAFSNNLYQPYEFHLNNNSSKFITSATIYINSTVNAVSNFLQLISSLILSIAISIAVFRDDGSVLSTACNAAVFALVDCGVAMNGLAGTTDCAIIDNNLIFNPNKEEEAKAVCNMFTSWSSTTQDLIASKATGITTREQFMEILNKSTVTAKETLAYLRLSYETKCKKLLL